MPHLEIVQQNLLDMAVPPGIGILHPDHLQMTGRADLLLLPVPELYHIVLKMFLAVQLDGKHRRICPSLLDRKSVV